jgi:uncharacterized protein (TIGR00369 family)
MGGDWVHCLWERKPGEKRMTLDARTRTVSWEDPMIGANAGRTMSGLEYLQAMIRGELPRPPIAALLNFWLTEAETGRAVFVVEPGEYHYNPIGMVHGGLAATVLDSALGCAIQSMLPAGTGYTTIELHVNMLRPVTVQTGQLRCEGEIIHNGRRMATAQARLTDLNGKLYAHGTATCMILNGNEG